MARCQRGRAKTFCEDGEVRDALHVLDSGLEQDNQVRIGAKGGGWITLTPLDAQPDPPTLTAFKADLNATWPMTSLLDMVKETDLRLGFTKELRSPTAFETLGRSVLQPRLLLCLHGIGTNAGLQRMASSSRESRQGTWPTFDGATSAAMRCARR